MTRAQGPPDAAAKRASLSSQAGNQRDTELHLLTAAQEDAKDLQVQLAAAKKRYGVTSGSLESYGIEHITYNISLEGRSTKSFLLLVALDHTS